MYWAIRDRPPYALVGWFFNDDVGVGAANPE
jgi:hypothetical protein